MKFDKLYRELVKEQSYNNNTMKDLTDYITKDEDDGKLYVDVYDVDSGEPLWEDKEVFTFNYNGKVYRGYAIDEDGDEVARVRILKNK